MQKKVLSEIGLYSGDVTMPKGFEIDRNKLQEDILNSRIYNKAFPFSRTMGMLNTYINEHINVEHGLKLVSKEIWGNSYKPKEISPPILNIDPMDLKRSPDYVLLYGVNVDNCNIRIHYDDNRRQGNCWDISLTTNQFIMFPSMQMYYITNNQKDSLNFIQTIIYEFI